jgi:hypothetical protein
MVTPLIYSDSRCSVAGCRASRRRQPATWTDQLGALLEGLRDANRLRGHAGAQPVGQPVDLGTGLLGGWSPSWRRTSGQSRRQASGRSPRSPKASTAASQDHGQPDRVGFTTPNGADFDVQGHRTFPLLPVLLACKAAPRTVKVVIQPLLVSMGTHRVRHNCLWWGRDDDVESSRARPGGTWRWQVTADPFPLEADLRGDPADPSGGLGRPPRGNQPRTTVRCGWWARSRSAPPMTCPGRPGPVRSRRAAGGPP